MSMAYHPQTDRQSEQMNQTLETFRRIFYNHQQNNWAKLLLITQYTMNAQPSSMTKKAPFEALMGYIPTVHQHIPIARFQNTSDRLEAIKLIRREAQSHMTHAQELLTKTNQFQPYTLGQKVWLEATNLKTSHPMAKLRAKRYGPFLITNVISHIAYQLDLPPQWKIHNVFHVGYLLPYKEMEEHGPNFPEPPPELVEGEPEYEIERIVNMRCFGRNKKLQYKVHWKGYAEAHDSWEPVENIHAPELLKEYHQESRTGIHHIHINTHSSNNKKTSALTPIFIPTPSKTFYSSLTMMNIEQDYEEQHITKEQQYRVLTRDMPHPTPYCSPSPEPIPIPPCLDEISPICSEIGSKLWEQTHFLEGLDFLRTQSLSSPAPDHPLSAATSLSYLTKSNNNPLAEFPHTSAFNTPYTTPKPFKHTDWGEEIAVEDIRAPSKDLRQFSAHPGAHWVVYNPYIHSNYILIPAGPEGNTIFAPARYITFRTNMHTGEPEILGTNRAGHRIFIEPLEATPSQGPTLANNTDLEHLEE